MRNHGTHDGTVRGAARRSAIDVNNRACRRKPGDRSGPCGLTIVRAAGEWSGEPYDRAEYTRERERAGREGGGPEAERQLELGPERALAELSAI